MSHLFPKSLVVLASSCFSLTSQAWFCSWMCPCPENVEGLKKDYNYCLDRLADAHAQLMPYEKTLHEQKKLVQLGIEELNASQQALAVCQESMSLQQQRLQQDLQDAWHNCQLSQAADQEDTLFLLGFIHLVLSQKKHDPQILASLIRFVNENHLLPADMTTPDGEPIAEEQTDVWVESASSPIDVVEESTDTVSDDQLDTVDSDLSLLDSDSAIEEEAIDPDELYDVAEAVHVQDETFVKSEE